MKSSLNIEMQAVAFLYDHLDEFPHWIRRLTPGQLEGLAKVLLAWHGTLAENVEILPLHEVEKRQITRAITLCNGDILRAARALHVGKTTLYRKLRKWGYSVHDRKLIYQASVLARGRQSSEHTRSMENKTT